MGTIAVTGATGYLAEKLIERLITQGHTIHAIARNEGKLIALREKFKGVQIFPCPIEDYLLLKKALNGCDGIFHLAAFKDVILAKEHPLKAVQTNILGTLNLLKITVEEQNIKFILATSTDKAVQVSGTYGATKLLMENLFGDFEQINGSNCAYRIVRYGNVLHSTGSVLVKWKYALENRKELILTDPEATRFFITWEQAIDVIFSCLNDAQSAGPFYPPNMKSISLGILLELTIRKYAKTVPDIRVIGLQKGENMHECITADLSSEYAERWNNEELLNLI